MSRLVKSMRNGLVALLACLPLVASGAGGAAPASGDPDAALGAVFKDIERSRLSDALDKVDEHMQEGRTPTFIDLSQGKTYFYPSLDVEPTVLPIFMHSLSWDEEDD